MEPVMPVNELRECPKGKNISKFSCRELIKNWAAKLTLIKFSPHQAHTKNPSSYNIIRAQLKPACSAAWTSGVRAPGSENH